MREAAILKGRGVIGIHPNELSAPLSVLIELTRRCNLNCMHCEANAGPGIPDSGLSTKQLKNLLDELAELKVFLLFLSGGEPLLRRDFFELANHAAQEKGFLTCLLTNATLINDHIAMKLKQSGIFKVEANLDGPCEIYDKFRGVKGAFKATVRGIEAVLRAEIPLRVNVCLTKLNCDHLEETLELASQIGIKEIGLIPLRPGGRAIMFERDLKISPQEYMNLLPTLRKLKQKYADKFFLIFVDPYMPCEETLRMTSLGLEPGCGAGRIHCTITASGIVKPCPVFPDTPEFIAGDCTKKSFRSIWKNASVFRLLRSPNIPICKDCPSQCMGGCRIEAYWHYGSLQGGPDPYCEKVL